MLVGQNGAGYFCSESFQSENRCAGSSAGRNIGLKFGPFSKRIIKRGVVTVASTEVWAPFPKNKNIKANS